MRKINNADSKTMFVIVREWQIIPVASLKY